MDLTLLKKVIICCGLLIYFITTSLIVSKALAEEKLVFGTDIRLRYEFQDNFNQKYYGRTVIHDPDKFSLTHRHFYESFGSYSHFTLPKDFFEIVFEPFFMTKRDNHDSYKGEDGITGGLNACYAGIRTCRKDIRGFDFDIVVKFDLPENNEIQLGSGHFWPGEFARKMASGKQADWVFFQWRYRFSWKIFQAPMA